MKYSFTSANYSFLLVCGLLIFLFSKSALLQGAEGQNHIDSEVYMYVASQCIDGKVLYKEVFDHKGPILYLINVIGLSVSGRNPIGIWLLQILFLCLSFYPLFKHMLIKVGWPGAMAASLFYISWIYRYMSIGDNTPELYAVGFLSICLAIYLKLNFDQQISVYSILIFGICAACLILLKLNFGVLLFPLIIATIIECNLRGKVLSFVGFGTLGALTIIIPILIYLSSQNALQHAYTSVWRFNLDYISNNPLSWIESLKEVILIKRNYFLWFILFLIPLKLLLTTQKKTIGYFLIFTFALGLYVLVGIPGRGLESRHYLLPFAPFVAILICWILYKLKDYVSYLVLILSMYFLYPMVLDIWSQRPKVLTITPEITYLKQINKPGINLFVIGNQSSLYRLSKLNSPTRYFYSYPILSNCNSDFTKSALDELNAKPADIICIEKSISHPSCIERLVKGYKLAINGSFFKIYIK